MKRTISALNLCALVFAFWGLTSDQHSDAFAQDFTVKTTQSASAKERLFSTPVNVPAKKFPSTSFKSQIIPVSPSTVASTSNVYNGIPGANYQAVNELTEYDYVKSLHQMSIQLKPMNNFNGDYTQQEKQNALQHCEALVYRTLKSLPAETVNQLKSLSFSFDPEARRGMGGGSTIILRCNGVTDKELVGVLVHEMGHIADTGVMQGKASSGKSEFMDGDYAVYNNDPSLDFYRISFNNESELKFDASRLDFVSGYAMSDPYEDFAETYNYYLLHGEEFRNLKAHNDALEQKYEFMKTVVFKGKEFSNDGLSLSGKFDITQRFYDTTVLNYDLLKFFLI